MNLVYCQLTSLLVLTSKTPQPSARGKQGHPGNASAVHAEAVSEYVIRLLNGEPVNGTQLGRALTPDAYIALLPTIWSFVSSTAGPNDDSFSAGILAAVLSHATRASSKSAIKKLTIEFVGRLTLVRGAIVVIGPQSTSLIPILLLFFPFCICMFINGHHSPSLLDIVPIVGHRTQLYGFLSPCPFRRPAWRARRMD